MAEEFVDLYEVLELPVDADRNTLRKRINELYLDAQRNLDHRTFATRVKYQELFEVTMPQARYILLDDGRRYEYDRLVHAYRNNKNGTPIPPAPSTSPTPIPKAEVDPDDALPLDTSATVEPLPANDIDPEQLAREREELWKKWKSGLEEALATDAETRPKARSAATSSPTSFSLQTEPPAAPTPAASAAPSIQAQVQPAPAAPAPAKAPPRPKVDISFDFEKKEETPAVAAPSGWVDTGTGELELTLAEIEQRRTEHRRQIMKEYLVNVGLIWGTVGALIILVPGFMIMVATIGHYYPRNAQPLLQFSPNFIWGGGSVVILAASYFLSQWLSKTMRRKKASEMAALTYEEVLKRLHKT